MSEEPITYRYDPAPTEPTFKEGATTGWLVVRTGKIGPARAQRMVALSLDGDTTFEPDGEWQDVTVVDDSQDEEWP